MDISTPTVSPLRQRMLDDMRMRKMAEHTQEGYIRAVRKLAAFLGRSPDTATIEELRRFQLHLVDAGTGPVTINATSHRTEVLLRYHPGPARTAGQDAARARAAHPAGGLEPRRSRTLDRRGAQPQAPGSDVGRLWRGLGLQPTDVIDLNEAFAAQGMAQLRDLRLPWNPPGR